ncbi:hypothetical protein LPJ78_003979 [Coemansia sp. RSA 989]|nr:quinon protein alcohol dehydrogenase-like superfamily [Coemansia mojavensis]KAJ1741256.1 hypothetical protein LPJ68_003020 [Coemansia sp. RSA 1086]KAJ1749518.1 hypothetical protein LPJ79_003668 [Coemansia sp. RSA 1821]KAJ1863528.1 hypothetical protein LPJ78_003979 [Coemansia sp. RSA 989]KAJ1871426.1 hypothetical protein LPJ55_003905 [Coemansia sp. RSA 990]KAJ2630698.1 hypothetical protein H4R22_002481 [Coemansia sp. RSA 1290]KAJ2652478.1 hypothetical protein IWW40_000963 [Coemansia sp. RSA
MEFSDLYKQSNSALAKFSPDGQYIAVCVEHRLIVRDSENPKRIHRVCSTRYSSPFIQQIEWAANSQYIMTASYVENQVDVWALHDETWRCSITDQVARIEEARWAPDSRHILTFSEFDLRLSIWGIEDESRRYVQSPKRRAGVSFHPAGPFMAVIQRHDHRDHLGIYSTEAWVLEREVPLDTVDACGVQWSPDGLHLSVWDTLASYHVCVVNVGGMIKRKYEDEGLGVTCVWSPTGQLLALAGMDRRLRVLNSLTWRPIATLTHRPMLSGDLDVFVESSIGGTSLSNLHEHSRFDLSPLPCTLQNVVPMDKQRGSGGAVSFAQFNAEGTLLATICDSMPHCLWVWRIADMRLVTVIQTLKPLRRAQWSPVESSLAFCTNTPTLYLWRQNHGCHLFEIPSTSVVSSLSWNPNAGSLALLSKGLFALAYVTEDKSS